MTLSVEDFLLSIQKLILGNDLNTTYVGIGAGRHEQGRRNSFCESS